MKKSWSIASAFALAFIPWQGNIHAAAGPQEARMQAATDTQTLAIVAAAKNFLDSLGADQREKVQFTFTPQKRSTAANFQGGMDGRMTFVGEKYGESVWSNYPVSDVPRPGLRLGNLSALQRAAAMHLLRVVLSPKGYQKVTDIMNSDQALSERGTPFESGVDAYTAGIFGQPSSTMPWMLQFGGHHLGLNVTIVGEHGVLAPTLTGAQPAVYTSQGKTVRVLAEENDKAFALLDTLDANQRKEAILNYRVSDLVLGPGHEGQTILSEGLKGSAMTEQQRVILLDLISEWAGIINEAYGASRMAEIRAGLNDTYFAWSGPTSHETGKNGSAYYRIQGPNLVIEFAPQDVGGDATLHVHTIYRDPSNDYGRALTIK